jgi:hypothetical protein
MNVRLWLAVTGIALLIGLAMTRNRDLVEQTLGALMICDGLLRLYSLATHERDELPTSSRSTAALGGVSTVLLGAGFLSLKSEVGMLFLALAVIVPLAAWLFQKVFRATVRTGR